MATAPLPSVTSPVDQQDLFDLIPLPAWIFDTSTLRFLSVNDAAVARYGFSRDEFLRMTILEIRPPAEEQVVLENIARRSTAPSFRIRVRHRTRSGEVFQVEVVSRSLVFEGRPAHFVVAIDMSEH